MEGRGSEATRDRMRGTEGHIDSFKDEGETISNRQLLPSPLGCFLSCTGLLIVLVVYCVFGALLFRILERRDIEQRISLQQQRENCIKELWLITEHLNVLYEKNWTFLVSERLRHFEAIVTDAVQTETYDENGLKEYQWSYGDAFFYSISIITTVGFGKTTPKNASGMLVTMAYAAIGVPLVAVFLLYLGSVLGYLIQSAYSKLCRSKFSYNINCASDEEMDSKSQSALINAMPDDGTFIQEYPWENSGENSCEGDSLEDSKDQHEMKLLRKPDPQILLSQNAEACCSDSIFSKPKSADSRKVKSKFPKYKASPQDVKDALETEKTVTLDKHYQQEEEEILKCLALQKTEKCYFCDEERRDGDEDMNTDKEWSSSHPETPSRHPLIRKTQPSSHSTSSNSKHLYSFTQPKRPSTPMPKVDEPKKRSKWSDYLTDNIRQPSSPSTITNDKLDSETSEQNVPIWFVIGGLFSYVCIGGVTFSLLQDWTFLDSLYFCFSTLSTIGFPDIITLKSTKAEEVIKYSKRERQEPVKPSSLSSSDIEETEQHLKLVTLCIYLLLGLIFIATSISLVQSKVIECHNALYTYLGISTTDHPSDSQNERNDESNENLKELSLN